MTSHQPAVASSAVSASFSTDAKDGVAFELPMTRPFEGFTYIRKEWIDQEDDIEKVTINISLGHIGHSADWSNTEVCVMMPEWGTSPLRRTWIVRLPTHLETSERYLFHYFFHVFYTNGKERVSHTFSQLVVPQVFEFIDHAGDFLFVRLHWSIGPWSYPQDTDLECEGIEWGGEFSVSNLPYRREDKLFQNGRLLVMNRLLSPRRYRGIIWAPRGSEINYCFQLLRHVADGFESLWDNNFGKNYRLTI
ncbi:MAG: hypothetical protein HQM09_12610 [Candidatus Riflebacteria bacterium]|nr:hypothetical protein [Candidatus Riflebacteria bacterium]